MPRRHASSARLNSASASSCSISPMIGVSRVKLSTPALPFAKRTRVVRRRPSRERRVRVATRAPSGSGWRGRCRWSRGAPPRARARPRAHAAASFSESGFARWATMNGSCARDLAAQASLEGRARGVLGGFAEKRAAQPAAERLESCASSEPSASAFSAAAIRGLGPSGEPRPDESARQLRRPLCRAPVRPRRVAR